MNLLRPAKVALPLLIVLLGAVVAVVLIKSRPAPPKRPAQVPRPLVEVHEVNADTAKVVVTGYGTIRAKRKVTLVPQVSGVVVRKSSHFEPGEFFPAGEVLLTIDETDYRLAAERAASEVARAEYNLALAQEEADVAAREWKQIQSGRLEGTPPPSPLVLHEPQLNLASAELVAARAALDQAQVNLERCRLIAPFAGRVLSAAVDAGQYLRAGTSVGSIYATDVAEIIVPVADVELAWISVPGSPADQDSDAGSTVAVSADFAGGIHHWTGRVVRLGGAIDERSRRVPVIVEIPDPYATEGDRPPLVEGMFVAVRIEGSRVPGAVTIPRSALRPGDQVWVVDPEDRLQIRPVVVARAGVKEAVITRGLSPGERICVSSLQYVSDGMQVRVAGAGGVSPTGGDQAGGPIPELSTAEDPADHDPADHDRGSRP